MLRRGLPIGDVFCVQAAIALSRFPLVGAGRLGKVGFVLLLGEHSVAPPADLLFYVSQVF